MDPITALQTASAIIGIVDFGARLFSNTYEIYQSASGLTARNVGLSTLSDELNILGKQLQDRLAAASNPASAADKTLRNLSGRCIEASNKLQSAIRDLQARESGSGKIGTVANSFASALKAVWKDDEIESLKEELTEIRSQITFAGIISLWLESKQDGQRHIELEARVDEIAKKLDSRYYTTQQFAREFAQVTEPHKPTHLSHEHTDLVDILWGLDWKSWAASHGRNLSIDAQSDPHTHVNGAPIPMKILAGLQFREINSSKEAIPEAYASTCSWIFRDSETDKNGEQLEWSSFPAWLNKRNQEIYWITGKIGSGKSTLMKYIIGSPELQTHLQEYAGDLPCLQACFFFWNPGSEMETSRQGLLRALLHQCLVARPELIPAVAPRRWALYSLLGGKAVAPEWTWEELKESFGILCSFHGQDFRLALFIDGLDEFKGPTNSPRVLVSWIRDTATHYGIKICVSSRPWNVFADEFGEEPSLTMQNFTGRDIEHFVRTEFNKNIAFQELKGVLEDDTASIIKEIIEKAQGVFLWVSLVVRNLLSILDDFPSLPDLKQKLAEIPSDIVGLYNAIWLSIPTERHCRSSKILQICVESVEPCRAEVMWLATEDKPNLQASTNAGIRKVMKRILDGHTRGICELVQGGVQFLHRSAADWIKQNSTRAEINSKTPSDFDPNLNLLEACFQYHEVMKAHNLPTPLELDYMARILLVGVTKLYNTAAADRIRQLNFRLIQAADDVDTLGYDLSVPGGYSSVLLRTGLTKDSRPEVWSTSHWLARQAQEEGSWDENCFVGCAASAGFVDYVKKKLHDDPSLLEPKERRVSILENAICIHCTGKSKAFIYGPYLTEHSYRTGKLEIIRLILETSPHRYKTASGQSIYERISEYDSACLNPEAKQWWQEVREILEEHGYDSSMVWRQEEPDCGEVAGPNEKASHSMSSLRRFKNELRAYIGKFKTKLGGGSR